jgi:hypothetical protein
MPEPPRNIIFLHVPKAAGSTLRQILLRQYREEETYRVSTDPSVQASIEQFRDLLPEERKSVRCVTGHGTFGLHKDLFGSTEYITLLRDPVERVISNYYYVRRSPGHRCYDDVVGQQMSLRDYVSSEINPQLENGMTRVVSGANWKAPDADTLVQAKENLREHFGVVGTVERFDETVVLLRKRYGWIRIGYRKRNVASSRPTRREIPNETRRLIEENNRLDAQLYRHASSRLQEALAGVGNIDAKLRHLRFRCQVRTMYAQTRRAAGKLVRSILPHS